jgi:hypothetical protein
MEDEKEVERLARVMFDSLGDGGSAFDDQSRLARDVYYRMARAVLASTSYSRGYADAVRDAVEAVEDCDAIDQTALGNPLIRQGDAVDAIRSLAKEEHETHEARWAALGYFVEWSDLHRAYRIGSLPTPGGEGTFMLYATEPTVQAVDAWIAAREKEVGK